MTIKPIDDIVYIDMKIKHTFNNKMEYNIAMALSKLTFLLLINVFKLMNKIGNLLWKVKRHIFRLLIILFVITNAYTVLHNVAYAPKSALAQYQHIAKPLTEKEQIINYILERFGAEGQNAVKVAQCESHLNPTIQGHNLDFSTDTGIFQINSTHAINAEYLKDWHVNVDVAFKMWSEQGWNPWVCVTKWGVLDK